MLTLFTAPTSTDVWTGVSAYSADTFTNLLPIIYIMAGFIVGGLIVSFVLKSVLAGVGKVLGRGRGGRRRGRRR